eukprot:jgi/Mesen1/8702/ME000052S08128
MASRMSTWHSVLRNRWLGLAAATWMESCAGIGYMYSLYSQSLKTTLGYSQTMVDGLGMAKDIGGNVGITSGFIGAIAPTYVVLLVGGLENLFGYLMLWLALTKRISTPPFWAMCIYICIGTNGATFFNTATLVTCVKNFPASRGPVVGLLKGYIGLGGAIFTQIYLALYAPDRDAFLFLASWLPAATALLIMPVVHLVPYTAEDPAEKANLLLILAGSTSLALYLLGANLLDSATAVSKEASAAVVAGALVLLALPAIFALKQQQQQQQQEEKEKEACDGASEEEGLGLVEGGRAEGEDAAGSLSPEDRQSPEGGSVSSDLGGGGGGGGRGLLLKRNRLPRGLASEQEPLIRGGGTDSAGEGLDEEGAKGKGRLLLCSHHAAAAGRPKLGEDHTLLQAFATAEFWLIYVSMTLASGSGLTAINNLGQIGRSLGYGQDTVGVLVSLMSIWNFFGRVGGGYIPEYLVQEFGWPRPVFMVLTQLLLGVGHLLFAINIPGALYIGSAVVGLCYGAQWGLMPAVASEVFGLHSFGNIYNWLTITNPTGSYLLSVCVAGYLYDVEAEKELHSLTQPPPGSVDLTPPSPTAALMCHGTHCFQTTFFVMAFSCAVAALASVVLSYLTRSYYKGEFCRKEDSSPSRQQPLSPAV